MKIQKIKSREILDSRGNPTVEVEVFGENKNTFHFFSYLGIVLPKQENMLKSLKGENVLFLRRTAVKSVSPYNRKRSFNL